MIDEMQKRIAEGHCYLCATSNFQHKELCSKNPNRPASLDQTQIQIGGVYRFRALPRSFFVPSEGVARILKYEWTKSHGIVFHIQLMCNDGSWLYPDKPYGRISLYDVEFFNYQDGKN